jgi:Cu/Ag efflux pump CusA
MSALIAVALLLGLGLLAVPQLGSGHLLPNLQDRNVLVRLQAASGTSLTEMSRVSTAAAAELRSLPGVQSAGAHVGRAIGADEIVDVNSGEIWLTVAPHADYGRTINAIRATIAGYPGMRSSVRTYADDQLAAAGRTTGDALVVRVYGQDPATLRDTADDVSKIMATVPGVLSPKVEPQTSEPTVEIEVDLAAAQRLGLRPGDVRREATTLISGLTVGSLYEQQKIYDVVVWGGPATEQNVDSLKSLLIDTPSGGHVRIGDVANVRIAPGPAVISHDAVSRSLDVTATVHGRNVAAVDRDITSRLRGLSMPFEYRAEVLGDASSRDNGRRRMWVVGFIVTLLVFLLMQAATGSWRSAAALFVAMPLSVVGGIVAAPLVGGIDSVGVIAGLFAVFALAVRQGLTLLRRVQRLTGEPGTETAAEAVRRSAGDLAPSVVATALVSAAALLALAVTGGSAGLEILQPFAVTVLCGLVSSTVVVLFLVPTLCVAFSGKPPRTSTAHVLTGVAS